MWGIYQAISANILHEDKPYFLVRILHIFLYSFSLNVPLSKRLFTSASDVRYSIILHGAYLSCLSCCNIAGSAAVLAILVSIAFKLLSAIVALEVVVCLSVHGVLMGVPPEHSAGVRAKLFLSAFRNIRYNLAALLTKLGIGAFCIPMYVRTHGAGRQTELGCDTCGTASLKPHIIDCNFLL